MNYNTLIAWLLRSPLHFLLSKNTLLLTVTGRKSGRQIVTPVNFVRQGTALWATSTRQRTWWRNLLGGAACQVVLDGRSRAATGVAFTDPQAVADGLRLYFQQAPGVARYFQVKLDAQGNPDAADLPRAAAERVVVRFEVSAG